MDLTELQRNWDAFGRTDPFWAILTDPNRRGNRWEPGEFFATGKREVAALLAEATRFGLPRYNRRALDFGCGVGRVTQALAERFEEAIGVDVAPSMIELARQLNAHGRRCRYEVNDRDDLSAFTDQSFDVVYSGRVLQHVEPRHAESYIREFVRVLTPGGLVCFDVPSDHGLFSPDGTPSVRSLSAYQATLEIRSAPSKMEPGGHATVTIALLNSGTETWRDAPLHAGNHWTRPDGTLIVRDDGRADVQLPWAPGESRLVSLLITAPEAPGPYDLQCDLVEEGVMWFADVGSMPAARRILVGGADQVMFEDNAEGTTARDDEPRMEMHAVPRRRVEQLLTETGARLLEVHRVEHCGPTWLAFRYYATR